MVQILPGVVVFPPVTPTNQESFLQTGLNGADIPNAAQFRANLGLGSIVGVLKSRFLAALSTLAPGGLNAFEQFISPNPDDPLNIAYRGQQFVNSDDTLTAGFMTYAQASPTASPPGLGLSLIAATALTAAIFAAST